MNRRCTMYFGRWVDALAWRGMHAIARRQEARLAPRLPQALRTRNVHEIFPAPLPEHTPLTAQATWHQRGQVWRNDLALASPMRSEHAENNTVYVRAYSPTPSLQHPAVIVLHGLMNFTTAAYRPFLHAIVASGASAYVLELPYHHRRTPRGSLSGDLFHTMDLARTQSAVQQAVADVRAFMRYLHRAGASQVGVLGFSLGAWIGGLVACCETALDFAFFGMPPNHLNELVWDTALGAELNRHFRAQQWSREATAEFYATLDPRSYQPVLPRERIHLYAAEFDTLIALAQVQALQRAWGMPCLRTYPHGHLTIMLSRQFHQDFRHDLATQLAASRQSPRA